MDKIIVTTQPELKAIIEQIFRESYSSLKENTESNEGILTIEEAAAYLQVPKGTIYQLTHRREIPFNKVGRSLRFRKGDLDSWLISNKKKSRSEIAFDYNNSSTQK